MRIRVLVEGASEAAFFGEWLPRAFPQHYFQIIPHQGKGRLPGSATQSVNQRRQGLLDQLPAKLRAYGRSLQSDTERVLVVVDLDRDNCVELKNRMLSALTRCEPRPVVLFRIAIEETEAYFLGEWAAIRRAFPSAKKSHMTNYHQDSVCGTWEVFQTVIGSASEAKVAWAKRMGRELSTNPRDNKSPSFQQLCTGLANLLGELGVPARPNRRG